MASSAADRRALTFVVPGRLDTRTGGYGYDRRIVGGLRRLGWPVDVREVPGAFPHPSTAELDGLTRAFAGCPDGSLVVVDGLAFGAAPAQAASERARLRLVALVHHPLAEETGLAPFDAAALAAGERRALAAARAVVVTSHATAAALEAYGVARSRIAVVEPGTDPAPLARGSHDGLIRLVSVGSVIPRKGHLVLIDALARLSNRSWRLTCVGSLERDPAAVETVRQRLRAGGLDDLVALAGEADAAGVNAYYDASDLFVLPTFHEGYGMAVAEAIAHGLPVISTRTGGIPELVGGEAGILVGAGDVSGLATTLSRVLADAGLRARLAAGARERRSRLPTWEGAAARFGDALRTVIAGD
jgi:glycosyltransferase involved in cell wall biosynthesis